MVDGAHQFLAGLGSGLAGGLLSGAFGIGGGIVLVPLLALALHLDQHRAQGVTLAAMLLPNSLPAVLHFRRQGVAIHWGLVAWMTGGFLPGLVAGSFAANAVPGRPLRLGFACFLVLLAAGVWRSASRAPSAPGDSQAGRFPPLPAAAIGLAGGACAGLLGIGGGVVVIPLLLWAFPLSQREAQLQSLVLLLPPLGLPGVLVYAASSELPWLLLGGVALGFAAGAALGARATSRMRGPWLSRGFALLLVAMAALLLQKT
ncbi:MAG: sulfite exporter TauE/SafE family protein [Acidobacteria bacterium]|nr:sulfite exporter TauE/SafE family protein [Acidobacteriota bacterium]